MKPSPTFEIEPGWEILSSAYEATIQRHVAAMPLVCTAGLNRPDDPTLYEPEPLLRHFSECLLHQVVAGTPSTDAFDKRLAGAATYDCLHPSRSSGLHPQPIPPLGGHPNSASPSTGSGDPGALASPRRTPTPATLCFRLDEAAPEDVDSWQLHFLVAARSDPSYQVSLAEYWPLSQKARAEAARPLGASFERPLLALGAAARIYPAIWDGLATTARRPH